MFSGWGKKVITYRHLWRENWTELIVSHCTGLCFCSQEKEKRRRKKNILWAFYCRIGSEETAGARLFFFFFFPLSLPLSFFFDAVLSRCSTSGKGESEKQRWWLGRGRACVINNCISLSDAGNSV